MTEPKRIKRTDRLVRVTQIKSNAVQETHNQGSRMYLHTLSPVVTTQPHQKSIWHSAKQGLLNLKATLALEQ